VPDPRLSDITACPELAPYDGKYGVQTATMLGGGVEREEHCDSE